MAIDPGLLERVRDILGDARRINEKRMFGGVAFLCDGNLFLGVRAERLMVRVGAERYQEALELPDVRPMVHSGRSMTGYVYVDVAALDDDDDLRRFVQWGLGVAAALPPKNAKAKAARPGARKAKKPPQRKGRRRTPEVSS